MARVTLDTTNWQFASAESNQRKIVKTSSGALVLFANLGTTSGTRVRYAVSTDYGATWGSWNLAYNSFDATSFSLYIDGSDNIYFVCNANNDVYSIKFTYTGSNTWSTGSTITVTTSNWISPVITKRSNGDFYVTAIQGSGTTGANIYRSTNDTASWTNVKNLSISPGATQSGGIVIFPVGSDIQVLALQNSIIHCYTGADTTWTDYNSITGPSNTSSCLGGVKKDDNNIWIGIRTSSGIVVHYYNGSTWDAGTAISNNSNDASPALSLVSGQPWIVWKDYDGANYNIAYRKWNGASWDAQVLLTNDSAVDFYPNVMESATNLYVYYMTGSSSPYTLYFDTVVGGWQNKLFGVSGVGINTINGVSRSLISKVNGV